MQIKRQGLDRSGAVFQKKDMQQVSVPFLKRPFDIFFAGLGLLFSSWLWALIWILIILEDGYPVFIKQVRLGKDGIRFKILKFRSMQKDASRAAVDIQADEDDKRITRIGRFLRQTALDELPQLLNIFAGTMSFVGPRALLSCEIEVKSNPGLLNIEDIPGYEYRILVKSGLTGLAQLYAPRDIARRQKFKYDILYIRKMNFLLDIRLIALSFLVTLWRKWERRDRKLEILKRRKKV